MDARQSDISLSRQSKTLNFLDLNDDVFEKLFSYLSFDDIAKIRLVCSRFNNISKSLLKKGATAVKFYNIKCQKEIIAKLPRRDSERKAHPLFDHVSLLTGVESKLSHLLNTYNNEHLPPGSPGNNTCFIAGKFLDECYRVMKVVMTNQQKSLNYSLTKELSDIYHMAVNHFKEHILPANVKKQHQLAVNTASQRISFPTFNFPPWPSEFKLKDDDRLIDNQKKEISDMKSKMLAQEKLLNEHERKLLLLEQHLGLSLSQKTTSLSIPSNPVVASTSGTTLQPSKRSLQQDDEEPRPTKRLQ